MCLGGVGRFLEIVGRFLKCFCNVFGMCFRCVWEVFGKFFILSVCFWQVFDKVLFFGNLCDVGQIE